jgi:hypothetical protein
LVKKIKEIIQSENDIYFLEVISSKIVINNNYKGIIILSQDLEILKEVDIFDDIMIYSGYINEISEELLLFCPENECLVYVNINTYEWKVINICGNLNNIVFSPVYMWDINELILSTYNGDFYSICIKQGFD